MAAFYATKNWYQSKTILASIVGVIFSIFGLFGVKIGVDPTAIVSGILFVATAIFRFQATTTIGTSPAVATTVAG